LWKLSASAWRYGGTGPACSTIFFLCSRAWRQAFSALADARRRELAQSYAGRALKLLRQSVAKGFKDAAHMRQDPDLKPLQAREEFNKLLAELEAKSKK
jgi:hypothetical protein